MDFRYAPEFYDTFALRDTEGCPAASQRFPFFGAGASREAMLQLKPVPVKSCWNGMVAFAAAPFLSPRNLRFRGIADDLASAHLEGSECCLVHYDNERSEVDGVWVNPNVRVGYTAAAYEGIREWPKTWDRIRGRNMGLWTALLRLPWRDGKVVTRVGEWERKGAGNFEPGVDCLIDEMHVLVERVWKHV
jgi:hypothetical protein